MIVRQQQWMVRPHANAPPPAWRRMWAAVMMLLLLLAICAVSCAHAQKASVPTATKNASVVLPRAARPATNSQLRNGTAGAAPPPTNATAGAPAPAANNTASNTRESEATKRTAQLVAISTRDAEAWLRVRIPRNATGPAQFDICVAASQPYAVCDEKDPETHFSGFEVELFREVAPRVPWLGAEGGKWRFKCVTFSDQGDDMRAPNGMCLLGMGGVLSKPQDLNPSSVSYIDKGFAILMLAHQDHRRKLFSPFLAFSWQLWLALITTAVAVSGILWVLDTGVRAMDRDGIEDNDDDDHGKHDKHDKRDGDGDCPLCKCTVHAKLWKQPSNGADVEGGGELPVPGTLRPQFSDAASQLSALSAGGRIDALLELLHRAHGKGGIKALKSLDETLRVVLLNLARAARTPSTSTLPAQVVLWAWGLLTMITISMFTGATAAALTTNALSTGVRRLSDLHGKSVIVYEAYERRFNSSGIIALPYPWENLEDELDMIRDLRAHKAEAIIMDSNWVEYFAGTQCDLAKAGDPWMERYVAYMWHINATNAMVDQLDYAIKSLKEEGVISDLRERLVASLAAGCSENAAMTKATTVQFGQVAGLWVILALAVLAALIMAALLFVTRRIRQRQREKLRTTISRASLRLQSRNGMLSRVGRASVD